MPLSDRNILITPNRGSSTEPNIRFTGADAGSSATITLRVLNSATSGILSFEGNSGQLLSITDNTTGTIFRVNNAFGTATIETLHSGQIKLAENSGLVQIGGSGNQENATSTTTGELVVIGGAGIGRDLHIGGNIYQNGSLFTGVQGIQGRQGIQGITGTTGNQGVQGVAGSTGNQGVQGITGNQGIAGSQGIQGIQGSTGTQGFQGISGTVGGQGIQGITGATGNQGVQGITGAQGITGTTGSQGIQGITGATGNQGVQGITGAQGITGTTGSQGIQGITGATGNQGVQGITGATGNQGLQGITPPTTTAQTSTNAVFFPTFVDANNATFANENLFTTSTFTINPSSGNVGIGTNSASALLHVKGTAIIGNNDSNFGTTLQLRGYASSFKNWQLDVGITGSNFNITPSTTNGGTTFTTAAFSIDTSGNVGIGNTTPKYRLDVNNNSGSNSIQASFGSTIGVGIWTGIHFGYLEPANTSYRKSALVFERTDNNNQGGNASGKIHFLLNNSGAGSVSDLIQSVLTIDSDANGTMGSARVGIQNRNPTAPLDIGGNTVSNIQAVLTRFAGDGSFNLTASNGTTSTNASGSEVARFGISYAGNNTTNFSSGFSFIRGGGAPDGSLAIFTNATERVRVTSAGGISFGSSGSAVGTSGQLLQSNGNASPSWISPSSLSAGSVANSVTFNSGGGGNASGITFNGSSAITVSHNTIGAMPLSGGTFSGGITVNSVTLPQNTVGVGYANTSTQPTFFIGQAVGNSDFWRIYGESPSGDNTGALIIQSEDDYDSNESVRIRFKRTYSAWQTNDIMVAQFDRVTFNGTIKVNTSGAASATSHLIIKRNGAAEPSTFGSYSGSWRSGLEIWNNDSTRMLFLNPPESDSLYANIKSVGGGFFIDVGTNGATRAIQIESTGAANFPQTLSVNSNTVLHAGNYNSYAPTLTGTGASGDWNIRAASLYSNDNRVIAPNEDSSNNLRFGFTSWNNNNTSPWADYLHLRSYSDASGGNDNLVLFRKDTIGMRIYQQTFGSASAYSSFKDIAFTDGSNASGTWGINITGNAATVSSITSGQVTTALGYTPVNRAGDTMTGTLTVPYLRVQAQGTEGGEIYLNKGSGQTNLSGSELVFDALGDGLRFFENGGSFRQFNFSLVSGGITSSAGGTFLHSGNYNSYSPTLTGTGASGTWGINITGNAATASTLQTARTINGISFNGGANVIVPSDWLHSDRDFPNGTLVTTNINYAVTYGDPWVLEIRGNSYGSIVPFEIQYQGYIYNDTIINHGGYSVGTSLSGLVVFNSGGNLCFWWPNQAYWHGYNVRVYVPYSGYPLNRVSSITNVVKPGGITKEVALSANIRVVLRSDNYNSYAPTLTGTGASGTWGISITGSAASVTGGMPNNVDNYFNVRVIRNSNTSISNDGMYIGYANSNNGLTRIYGGGSSSNHIYIDGNADIIKNTGPIFLHSSNYNSYAPTLTGGGASGTWGISISGTAATATNWGSYGGVPAAGTSFANANTIGRSDGNGYTYFNYINSNTGNSENPTVSQVIVTNGSDNFYRKASIAHLTSSLSGTAPISISGNAATATSATDSTKLPLAGGTMTGTLQTNIGGGASSSTKHIALTNGSGYELFFLPRGGSGSYNPITQDGDAVIGFQAGGVNTGGLVIAPWSTSSVGIRISSNGTITVSSTLNATTVVASNFADSTGLYNVNLGSGGNEGRGVVAGYSGGAYSGIGYNIRHTAASANYIAPSGDTTSYLTFNSGGFTFFGAGSGAAGRTLSLTSLATLNSSGAFNTAGAITQNGNQVLHAGNYNSYSPTLTGTGASGTWGIDITGRSRGVVTTDPGIGAGGLWVTSATGLNVARNGTAYIALDTGNFTSTIPYTYPGWPGNPGTDANNFYGGNWAKSSFTYSNNAPYTGAIAMFPAGGYCLQLNGAYGGQLLAFRNRNGDNGTWNAWRVLLTDGNYTSYSPSLTGSGASGTWGISITGGAQGLTRAGDIDGSGDYSYAVKPTWDGTYWRLRGYSGGRSGSTFHAETRAGYADNSNQLNGYSSAESGASIVLRTASNGYLYLNNWINTGAGGVFSSTNNAHFYPNPYTYGTWVVSGSKNGYTGISFLGPSNGIVVLMVQDNSNNTGFYNETYGWQLRWTGGTAYCSKNTYGGGTEAVILDAVNYTNYTVALSGGSVVTGATYFRTNVGGSTYLGSVSNASLQAYSTDAGTAYMSFHRSGYYAVNMGLDPDNVFRIGGWSASSNRLQMDMSGNLTMAGNVTAYSDIRLKDDIELIKDAVSKVEQIRGVTYIRNDETTGRRHTGVIAQEVEKVLPEAVTEDASGIKTVAYGNMVGLLVEAIKSHQKEIQELKQHINNILAKLSEV